MEVEPASLRAEPDRCSRRAEWCSADRDHEPKFTAHQTIVLDGKPFESNFELLSDGREVVTDAGGRRIVSTLRWDGDALVVTWRIHGPDGEVTISFRYELQDGGRRLRAAEQLRGGGRDQDNLWVFERP